jgi:hypothetical protein
LIGISLINFINLIISLENKISTMMRHGFLKTPLFKGHRTKIITQNAAMPFLVPNPRLGRGMPMPNSKLGKGASAPNPTLVRDAPAPNSTLGYGGSVSDHS